MYSTGALVCIRLARGAVFERQVISLYYQLHTYAVSPPLEIMQLLNESLAAELEAAGC